MIACGLDEKLVFLDVRIKLLQPLELGIIIVARKTAEEGFDVKAYVSDNLAPVEQRPTSVLVDVLRTKQIIGKLTVVDAVKTLLDFPCFKRYSKPLRLITATDRYRVTLALEHQMSSSICGYC